MKKSVSLPVILLATVTLLLIVALGCDATSNEQPSGIPLKIGLKAEAYSECRSKESQQTLLRTRLLPWRRPGALWRSRVSTR